MEFGKNLCSLETYSVASTNTAQTLAAAKVLQDGKYAQRAVITVETNSIRIGLTTTPTQAGVGHLLAAGATVTIEGAGNIQRFKFISAAADTHAALKVTLEF